MRELSQKRAICAMPIAGSYRSIDFTLSNMTNSHIQKVAVFTQYNARSLNEHLKLLQMVGFRTETGRTVCIHSRCDSGEQQLVQRNCGCYLSESQLPKEQP